MVCSKLTFWRTQRSCPHAYGTASQPSASLWQQQGASWTSPACYQLLWPTSRSPRPPESWLTLSLVGRGATATTRIRIDSRPSEMHAEGGSCRALNCWTLVHPKKRPTAKLLSLWGKGCPSVTLWTCCSEESLFHPSSSMKAPSVQHRGPALHQHRRLSAPLLSPSLNTDLVRTSTLNLVFLNWASKSIFRNLKKHLLYRQAGQLHRLFTYTESTVAQHLWGSGQLYWGAWLWSPREEQRFASFAQGHAFLPASSTAACISKHKTWSSVPGVTCTTGIPHLSNSIQM